MTLWLTDEKLLLRPYANYIQFNYCIIKSYIFNIWTGWGVYKYYLKIYHLNCQLNVN